MSAVAAWRARGSSSSSSAAAPDLGRDVVEVPRSARGRLLSDERAPRLSHLERQQVAPPAATVNALVEATPISGRRECRSIAVAHAWPWCCRRTLQMAMRRAPPRSRASRSAARVSAVSPDWLMTDRPGSDRSGSARGSGTPSRSRRRPEPGQLSMRNLPTRPRARRCRKRGSDMRSIAAALVGQARARRAQHRPRTTPARPAEQRVLDGPRLLVNLLEHEVLVAALLGHDRIPGNLRSLDFGDRLATRVRECQVTPVRCDETRRARCPREDHVPRVGEDCRECPRRRRTRRSRHAHHERRPRRAATIVSGSPRDDNGDEAVDALSSEAGTLRNRGLGPSSPFEIAPRSSGRRPRCRSRSRTSMPPSPMSSCFSSR